MLQSRLLIVAVALVGASLLAHGADAVQEEGTGLTASDREPVTSSHSTHDVICGPRCVHYLLKYYEKGDDDLISLASETQWPKLEAGASMKALETALQKRGVHTFPISIKPDAYLTWEFPVLLHLKDATPSPGHYVVWLPSSSQDEAILWCGLKGIEHRNEREVAALRSGAIMLTAPTPITNPDSATRSYRVDQRNSRLLLVCITSVAVLLLCLWKLHRHKARRSVHTHV